MYQNSVDVFNKDHTAGSLYRLRQSNDDDLLKCVNSVTAMSVLADMESLLIVRDQYGCPLFTVNSGVNEDFKEIKSLQHIGAAKQISLGIPLHPDCMTAADWQNLPGIGVKTANNIVNDRQLNGDFGSLDQVVRVRGVGEKTIEKNRKYFK